MMKRMRIAGLCLVAVCAVFAFTGTAFAAEGSIEFGKCNKVTGGKFKNSGCTKLAKAPAEEKFEWESLTGKTVKFTSLKKVGTGKAVLEAANGNEISCTEQKQEKNGEYGPGNTTVKDVIGEFSGCEASGAECNSTGKAAGHIDTFKLHGEPGIVEANSKGKEEKNVDGNDLRGESSELLAEFSCGPLPVKVRGGVVVKAGSVVNEKFKVSTNKMLNKATIEFVAVPKGKQVPEKWTALGSGVSNSGGRKLITEFLEGKVGPAEYEQSGQSLITIQKTVGAVKVELRQCEKNVC